MKDRPTACTRPPWWRTLERIDAAKASQKLLEQLRQSLKLLEARKK
jgi:hypothetical protein